jgi:hypothetical protein
VPDTSSVKRPEDETYYRKDFTMKLLKVLIAVISCTSFLFAQTEGSTAKEQTGTKAQVIAEQKAGEMEINGKVVSVDVKANTIIVKTRKTQDTLNVKSGAKIMRGMMELSEAITLDDLQADAKVTVTWEIINGKKTATKIVVKSATDSKWGKGTH